MSHSRSLVAAPTPPDVGDPQSVPQPPLVRAGDHHQSIRLRPATGQLGDQLGPADSDTDRQPDLGPGFPAQPTGRLHRRMPADVQERLLHRAGFDGGGIAGEQCEQRVAGLGVGRVPGLDQY